MDPGIHQVGMGCDAGLLLEQPNEVVLAQKDPFGQLGDSERLMQVGGDIGDRVLNHLLLLSFEGSRLLIGKLGEQVGDVFGHPRFRIAVFRCHQGGNGPHPFQGVGLGREHEDIAQLSDDVVVVGPSHDAIEVEPLSSRWDIGAVGMVSIAIDQRKPALLSYERAFRQIQRQPAVIDMNDQITVKGPTLQPITGFIGEFAHP